jgi:hypothetical protein
MSIIYSVLFGGLLCVIIYQDFRYRALSISTLVAGLVVAAGYSLVQNGWKQALMFAGINILLIAVQLMGITIYFSIKKRVFTNIINTYFGAGDLWFYAVVAFCFSPLNFVMFNLASCIIILIIYAVAGYTSRYNATIPFAGWVAIMMVFMVAGSAWHIVEPYDDYFLALHLFPGIK